MEINLAIKDSVNGWKDNAHVYNTAKACSSLNMLMGNYWTAITESLGMHNISCPIPVEWNHYTNKNNIDISLGI